MNALPSTVLAELLAEHLALRELMLQCEQLADELDAGHGGPEELTRAVARLRIAFEAHNRYEEQFLRPVLAEVDVRIDRMMDDHVAEHRLVRTSLESEVTGELRLAIDRLRRHLDAEERCFVVNTSAQPTPRFENAARRQQW